MDKFFLPATDGKYWQSAHVAPEYRRGTFWGWFYWYIDNERGEISDLEGPYDTQVKAEEACWRDITSDYESPYPG